MIGKHATSAPARAPLPHTQVHARRRVTPWMLCEAPNLFLTRGIRRAAPAPRALASLVPRLLLPSSPGWLAWHRLPLGSLLFGGKSCPHRPPCARSAFSQNATRCAAARSPPEASCEPTTAPEPKPEPEAGGAIAAVSTLTRRRTSSTSAKKSAAVRWNSNTRRRRVRCDYLL